MIDVQELPCPLNPDYLVRSNGEIVSKKKGTLRVLKPQTAGGGYKHVCLCRDGVVSQLKVHRLVALTFLGPAPGMEVNHKNGVKADNRLENLEWCTPSENIRHAYRTGLATPVTRDKVFRVKIPMSQVPGLITRVRSGEKVRLVASDYGVQVNCVYKIVRKYG